MKYIPRLLEAEILKALRRGKSVLLLGARQTGKTTLIHRISHDRLVSFVQPDIRQRYEKDPSLLTREIEAMPMGGRRKPPVILLDEVQKVPAILDVVQDLIDRHTAQFVLTGSSARKLQRGGSTNWLPGRVVSLKLDPLTMKEFTPSSLRDAIFYGSL